MEEEGGGGIVLKSTKVWKSENERKRKTADKASLTHLKTRVFF